MKKCSICLTKLQPAVLLGGLLKAFDEKSLRNSLITNKYTLDLVQLQITFMHVKGKTVNEALQ